MTPSKRIAPTILGVLILSAVSAHAQNFWEQTNGPLGGDIRAIAASSGGTVYMGTYGSGVYSSVDNGATWVSTGLTQGVILSLVVYPSNGEIFAGTFTGVAYSTDNGASWSYAFLSTANGTQGLAVDASAGYAYAVTLGNGFFRSSDNGQTWTPSNNGLTDTLVWAIAVFPSTGTLLLGTDVGGVFRSTDYGLHWTASNTGLSTLNITCFSGATGNTIHAGESDGVYLSTDAGLSWNKPYVGDPSYTYALVTDPGSGKVYAGTPGAGIFASAAGDTAWTGISATLPPTYIQALLKMSSGSLIAGTGGGGIYRTTDEGTTWIEANSTVVNSYIISMAVAGNGAVFAGSDAMGIYRTLDQGATWSHVDPVQEPFPSIVVSKGGAVFAGTYGDGLFRSLDNGATWNPDTVNLKSMYVYSLASDNSSGNVYGGTNHGVFRSTDNGATWVQMNAGLTDTNVSTVAVNPANGTVFAAGSHTLGAFRSTNSGASWSAVGTGLTGNAVSAFSFTTGGIAFAGTDGGVFMSTDNGSNWSPANGSGLTNSYILCTLVNALGKLYVGTYSGPFVTTDNGADWTQNNSGFIGNSIRAFAIDQTGYLYAATDGNGVYRSVVGTTGVSEKKSVLPHAFALEQNYPNPFNPTTTIRYALARNAIVVLEVYNVLGQRVAQLVNGEKPAGDHQVLFQPEGLASGVYFYRVTADNPSGGGRLFTATKKLMLVK